MRRTAVFAFLLNLATLAAAQESIRWKPWISVTEPRPSGSVAAAKRLSLLHLHAAVEFAAPPTPDDLAELRNRGMEVLSVLSERAFVVSSPDSFRTDGLNITWVGQFNATDKISALAGRRPLPNRSSYFVASFYPDVDMGDARSIAIAAGMRVVENPDLLDHDLLVAGTLADLARLAEWDEVEYIFPAAMELARGIPVNACAGALTSQGPVSHGVPTIGDGWDGPGRNAAALNYAFFSVTEKLPADSAKSEITSAFSEWAKYAKLTFTLSSDPTAARTLAVLFARGPHGDGYPFNGLGMIAHTFYPYPVNPEPIAGDLHFNGDEGWRIGLDTDLFSIALHETGHALGLGHSDNPADVMYPYYRRVTGLSPGDVAAILTLYAAQDSAPVGPSTPVAPLSIAVQSPPGAVTASSVTLGGTVSGGTGDVQVSWRNGASSGTMQGTRAWTAAIPLVLGINTITITARDAQQNTASASVTVTRQQGPALNTAIQISQPAASGSPVTISGTASDSAGVDRVSWTNSRGGSGAATGTTAWSAGPIALLAGQNTITVTAYGKSGGTATSTVVVTYTPTTPTNDTTPPTLTIMSPAGTNVATSAATVVFTGTASDSAGVTTVTWTSSTGGSGTATGTTSWKTAPIPLLVGTNTITIRASDAAGNVAWRSAMVTRAN
jgi:hypothetical protein